MVDLEAPEIIENPYSRQLGYEPPIAGGHTSHQPLERVCDMKPIIFGKNEKDATYCELKCSGFEKHTGRCIGWALFGNAYPGGESEEAFKKCPNNKEKA